MNDTIQRSERFDRAESIVRLGLWITALLMLAKLAAGHWGRSTAVFADGIESACDLAVSLGTLFALRVSRNPSDSHHPYGHGRAESIAALAVACAIVFTGLWTVINAVAQFHHATRPSWVAVAAAAGTIAAKLVLARYTVRAGRRLASPVLLALAEDHRKDALTSIGTLVGCGLAAVAFPAADPLVAMATGVLILQVGFRTFRDASGDLMDTTLPDDLLNAISQLAEGVEGVEHVHEIKGRRSGQFVIVDLKLEMDPEMTVQRSHAIATQVKRRVFDTFPSVGDVMIHVNPHDDPNHEDLIRL